MDDSTSLERTPDYNSTNPKGGLSYSAYSFVVKEISVLRIKFHVKIPVLRQARKR